MQVLPNFRGCRYGPLDLRGLFRARLDPDERLIAWGVASVKPASSAEEILGAIAPGPLAAIAGVATSSGGSKRVLVLTDRRLLFLRPDELGPSPEGLGVAAEADLDTLLVESTPTHYEALGPDLGRRLHITVKEPGSRDGLRLVEALESLAGDRPA